MKPKGIKKIGNKELKILWDDGHESVYSFRLLRQSCQCAMCVDERSGQPILVRDSIREGLEGLKVEVMGNYALGITFGDGHSTGLFTFDHLRKICPCGACAAPAETKDKIYLNKEDLKTRVD